MVTNVIILPNISFSFAHSSFTTYLEATEAKETRFPFPLFLLTLRPGHTLCRMLMFNDGKLRMWNFLKYKQHVKPNYSQLPPLSHLSRQQARL